MHKIATKMHNVKAFALDNPFAPYASKGFRNFACQVRQVRFRRRLLFQLSQVKDKSLNRLVAFCYSSSVTHMQKLALSVKALYV